MVRAMKYEVGGQSFSSKKAMTTFVRDLKARYEFGECIDDANDQLFLDELLCHHPGYDEKFSKPVKQLVIDRDVFGKRCLFLKYDDESVNDISTSECIKYYGGQGLERRVKNNAVSAFREEISDQIWQYKRQTPNVCEISGEEFDAHDLHVDHHFEKTPFVWLVEEFMTINQLSFSDIEIADCGTVGGLFGDRVLAGKWHDFHRSQAVLRKIHKDENMKAKKLHFTNKQ